MGGRDEERADREPTERKARILMRRLFFRWKPRPVGRRERQVLTPLSLLNGPVAHCLSECYGHWHLLGEMTERV
jgi:hypothetical protein